MFLVIDITSGLASSTTAAIGGYFSVTAGKGQSLTGGAVSLTTGEGTAKSSGSVVVLQIGDGAFTSSTPKSTVAASVQITIVDINEPPTFPPAPSAYPNRPSTFPEVRWLTVDENTGNDIVLGGSVQATDPAHGTKQLDLQSSTTMGYDTPLQLAVMSKHNGCTRMLIQQK